MSSDEDWREDCAPRRILELFSTKWTSMVLHVLYARLGGSARAGVLLRAVPGVSKKMLTQTLRDMEHAGLVHRQVEGTIPPAVEYSITELGKRFIEPIEMIYAWARENNDALDALKPRETSRRGL